MNFGQALEAAKTGSEIKRDVWLAHFVALQTPDAHSKMSEPYFYRIMGVNDSAGIKRVPYVFSNADLLATDWKILSVHPGTAKLYCYKNSHGKPTYLESEFNGNHALKRWPEKDKVL